MKSYESSTPRAAIGIVAVALTALTLGLGTVVPAASGPSERVVEIATAAPARVNDTRAPASAVAVELRYIEPIEVVAVREKVTSQHVPGTPARRKQS